jgi:DNA-binding transcriptional LysR family regulator
LRHLRALLEVAAAQSIGAGAARLGITQPAVSRQIKELEHAVGGRLLTRSARGVALTPAGTSLAGDAPGLLANADRLIREAMRAKRGIEGRCVIGAVATAAASALLRQVTERCSSRHPQIEVIIRELATPLHPGALTRGEIDLGIAHAFPGKGRSAASAIRGRRLLDDRLDTALLATSHPLATGRGIDAQSLADVPFLFMSRAAQPEFYDRVMSALGGLGLRPRIEETYDSLQTVWALVAQGRGWTIGFHSHLARAPLGTVAVPLAGFGLPFGLELLSRSSESSPPVRAVMSVFRELRTRSAQPDAAHPVGQAGR